MERHMWMWSKQAVPMTSTPLYSHNFLNIRPMSLLSLPYMILRLFFGTQTMWYLHSQTVCDKLLFIYRSFRSNQARVQPRPILRQGAFFVKYYSIAFAILPGLAGGLA